MWGCSNIFYQVITNNINFVHCLGFELIKERRNFLPTKVSQPLVNSSRGIVLVRNSTNYVLLFNAVIFTTIYITIRHVIGVSDITTSRDSSQKITCDQLNYHVHFAPIYNYV